jgi:nucleoside-diphosphate-sugar epimerase
MTQTLLIFGLGYSGRAIAQAAAAAGFTVIATSRNPEGQGAPPGVTIIPFDAAAPAIAAATHIIATAAPDEHGDPVLARYAAQITAAPNLRYIGYLSTTGVYGNADGAWVDEDSPPNFRLAGIYGPGRSMFDDLRAGTARRVVKPNHLFGRIHRDDIAQGVLQALQRPATQGVTIFNFSDDEPAASTDVVVEAARLLNLPPPEPIPYEQAAPKMSPMALSFWSENRRVANEKTKAALHLKWLYPTYREGLCAIMKEEQDSSFCEQKETKKL